MNKYDQKTEAFNVLAETLQDACNDQLDVLCEHEIAHMLIRLASALLHMQTECQDKVPKMPLIVNALRTGREDARHMNKEEG